MIVSLLFCENLKEFPGIIFFLCDKGSKIICYDFTMSEKGGGRVEALWTVEIATVEI